MYVVAHFIFLSGVLFGVYRNRYASSVLVNYDREQIVSCNLKTQTINILPNTYLWPFFARLGTRLEYSDQNKR